MLIIGTFLFNEINNKLNERFVSLLSTAHMLVTERYKYDLEKLQLINNQIVLLSIGEEFEHYLQNGQHTHLESLLNKFQKSRNLDIVALINSSNKALASTDTFENASKDSLNKLVDIALEGEPISSIERLKYKGEKKSTLMYIAVSPIYSEFNSKKVLGVLLVAQTLKANNSFDKLSRSLPILKVAILDQAPSLSNGLPNALKQKLAKDLKAQNEIQYDKKFDGVNYKSNLIPLLNYSQNVVGYLEVSISREAEKELENQNSIYLLICLIVAVFGIIFAGYWFNRNFVEPMTQIANSCDKLVLGDLNAQISAPKDKSEMKQTVNNFNRMVKQLQEKEQMRGNFISSLTHDLRTPLLAQKRVFDLIEEFEDQVSPDFLKLIKGLNSNNQHLLNMVNLLVETYKYDSEGIVLEKEAINLKTLVSESIETIEPLIQSKNILVLNQIDEDFPLVELDASQFKRIVINLVSNAVENIPHVADEMKPEKRIEISALQLDKTVEMKITDNGYGIPLDILPHIFDKFFSRNKTKQKVGSGLGLFICKLLVEAHGGSIRVESETNQGTTFIITIPL